MKGATTVTNAIPIRLVVSIHAPNEGSDEVGADHLRFGDVSIHAPNEGSDAVTVGVCVAVMVFQSTLPMKGATSTVLMLIMLQKSFNPRSQ